MKWFFLDLENINGDALNKIPFSSNDKLSIFYSTKMDKLPISFLEKISTLNVAVDYRKCVRGQKNELDMQLAAVLGATIQKHSRNYQYYIISNDKGYDGIRTMFPMVQVARVNIDTSKTTKIISTSLLTESELYQLDKRFASISTNDFNKIFEGSIEPTKAQRKDLKKFLTSVPHPRNEIAQRLGSMSLSKDKVERFFEIVQPYQMELA